MLPCQFSPGAGLAGLGTGEARVRRCNGDKGGDAEGMFVSTASF